MSIPVDLDALRDEPDGYSLIFDATGEVVEGSPRRVRLTPTKAVLHRPGTAPAGDGSCGHDCAPIGTGQRGRRPT